MVTTLVFTLPVAAAGQRVDRVLSAVLGDSHPELCLSRSRIQTLIDSENVTIDGASCKRKTVVKGGEEVRMELPRPRPTSLRPVAMQLQVLFEDADLVAINKPAGLVVHPGAGHEDHTLVHGLLAHCQDLSGIGGEQRPGIVHRLDRFTSGVMVVAKNDFSHQRLAEQFAQRTTQKNYRAWTLGVVTPLQGKFDTLYGRHANDRVRFSSRVSRGKHALTAYEVVRASQAQGFSELSIRLHTGRTHQIRVHCNDAGHPILGDHLYGVRRLRAARNLAQAARDLTRQALHAERLQILHPRSNAPLDLLAPIPPELQALSDLLE